MLHDATTETQVRCIRLDCHWSIGVKIRQGRSCSEGVLQFVYSSRVMCLPLEGNLFLCQVSKRFVQVCQVWYVP